MHCRGNHGQLTARICNLQHSKSLSNQLVRSQRLQQEWATFAGMLRLHPSPQDKYVAPLHGQTSVLHPFDVIALSREKYCHDASCLLVNQCSFIAPWGWTVHCQSLRSAPLRVPLPATCSIPSGCSRSAWRLPAWWGYTPATDKYVASLHSQSSFSYTVDVVRLAWEQYCLDACLVSGWWVSMHSTKGMDSSLPKSAICTTPSPLMSNWRSDGGGVCLEDSSWQQCQPATKTSMQPLSITGPLFLARLALWIQRERAQSFHSKPSGEQLEVRSWWSMLGGLNHLATMSASHQDKYVAPLHHRSSVPGTLSTVNSTS